MKQYCRYCAFCFEGDVFFCGEHDKVLSERSIKRENHCSDFVLSELGDVESGRQYKPRKEKREDGEQISMEVQYDG